MSHDLRVERWFDATPGEVFDAYTDPDAQREWYQDQPSPPGCTRLMSCSPHHDPLAEKVEGRHE